MPVLVSTMMRVGRLHREGKTDAQMASLLKLPVADIAAARAAMLLPEHGLVDAIPRPPPMTDEQQAEAREHLPKRIAERQRKAELQARYSKRDE